MTHEKDTDNNVVAFPSDATTLEVACDVVLSGAKEARLMQCVVVGVDEDGEFYIATSDPLMSEVNLLLDRAKKRIIDHEDSTPDLFE